MLVKKVCISTRFTILEMKHGIFSTGGQELSINNISEKLKVSTHAPPPPRALTPLAHAWQLAKSAGNLQHTWILLADRKCNRAPRYSKIEMGTIRNRWLLLSILIPTMFLKIDKCYVATYFNIFIVNKNSNKQVFKLGTRLILSV